jgi:hypothetical protein
VWSHDELEALAAGYALGSLDQQERKALEEHLRSCRGCAQLVAELRPVAGALPLVVEQVEPPPALRERILSAATAEGGASAPPFARSNQVKWWRALARPAAVAAALVLLAAVAGLAVWVVRLQGALDNRDLRIARSYQAIGIMAQAQQWWRLEATAIAPQADGVMAYSEEHSRACLVVRGLPPAQGGTWYYAWAVEGGEPARVGAMWRLGEQLWIIIPRDVAKLDEVVITLESGAIPPQPSDLVAARVFVRLPP